MRTRVVEQPQRNGLFAQGYEPVIVRQIEYGIHHKIAVTELNARIPVITYGQGEPCCQWFCNTLAEATISCLVGTDASKRAESVSVSGIIRWANTE